MSTSTAWMAALLLTLAPALPARTVRGLVVNPDGKAVAGAAVKLKSKAVFHVRSAISRKDGSFVFTSLNPRLYYELVAEHRGVSSEPVVITPFDSIENEVIRLELPSARTSGDGRAHNSRTRLPY